MNKFYFFASSDSKDEVTTINVFTTSARKAFALAERYFKANGFVGEPQMLAI